MRQPPRQPRRLSAPDGGSAAPWWQWCPWKGDGACKEQIVADVGPAGYWDDDVRDPSANRHRGLKMVTMNVTSWNSCRNYLRIVCDADLVFIQETKKHKEAAREVAAALYKQGWRAAFAPSHIKEKEQSGGVAILWRPHLDVWLDEEPIIAEARIVSAYLRHPALGVVRIYSVYLEVGGLGPGNRAHHGSARERDARR